MTRRDVPEGAMPSAAPADPDRAITMDELMEDLKRFLEAIGCTDVTITTK